MSENPYFPQDFSHRALRGPLDLGPDLQDKPARKPGALIMVTTSGDPEAKTYEFRSVSEALGHFERVQHERRYQNRDRWVLEPDGVHFHNILVLDTEDPESPADVVRSIRVVTPDGQWTDKVAHMWVTDGEPHWITTRGDYSDQSLPVVNYQFA